jgi:hypothetical protein
LNTVGVQQRPRTRTSVAAVRGLIVGEGFSRSLNFADLCGEIGT